MEPEVSALIVPFFFRGLVVRFDFSPVEDRIIPLLLTLPFTLMLPLMDCSVPLLLKLEELIAILPELRASMVALLVREEGSICQFAAEPLADNSVLLRICPPDPEIRLDV